MKYIIILGDGMSDYPISQLGDKTPLDVANKPNIDFFAQNGEIGLAQTVPNGLKPGSDTANLSVMGYNPLVCYSGRSPLEAVSIGIKMQDDDIAVRCNLVTLSDESKFEDKVMVDYSSSEISTQEAKELIEYVQANLGQENYSFHTGTSYRHCFIMHNAQLGSELTPPHDISDKVIGEYLPRGLFGELFEQLIRKSYDLLVNHPINIDRIKRGLNPANSIWLWGEGTKPNIDNFEQKYNVVGAVISAVDLIKGIGMCAGMKIYEVEGATGNLHTNFEGKAKACIQAFKDGCELVYVHIEAPDECGHRGEIEGKIKAIEMIDEKIVGYLRQEMDKNNWDYRMMIMPDHATPLNLKTHVSDPVPYIVYGKGFYPSNMNYNERNAHTSGNITKDGYLMMSKLLSQN